MEFRKVQANYQKLQKKLPGSLGAFSVSSETDREILETTLEIQVIFKMYAQRTSHEVRRAAQEDKNKTSQEFRRTFLQIQKTHQEAHGASQQRSRQFTQLLGVFKEFQ